MRDFVITVLIGIVIWFAYSYAVSRVHLQNGAISVEALVVETEPTPEYTYVRLEYLVKGQKYVKSLRTKDKGKFVLNQKVTVKVLPDAPGTPFLDVKREDLAKEVYYIMTFLVAYFIYRMVRLTLKTYTPNWQ